MTGASAGDIWLDLDQNAATGTQGFESAIVFQRPVQPGGSTAPAVGFYDGTGNNAAVTWRTALDVWSSGTIGGKYCTDCTLNDTTPAPSNKPDTLSVISGGGLLAGLVAATDSNFGSGNVQGIRITLSNLTDAELALFQDGFGFGWGTGTCGNDTIVGSVPAVPVPAALPLMLSALGGLGLIARRP